MIQLDILPTAIAAAGGSVDPAWKLDYSNVDRMTPEELAEKRREFDEVKAVIAAKPDRK